MRAFVVTAISLLVSLDSSIPSLAEEAVGSIANQETSLATGAFGAPLSDEFNHALLINSFGADPWISSYGGLLYYTQTSGADVKVWVGRDLPSLAESSSIVLWSPQAHHNIHLRNLWAPELHMVRGSWYLYVAADDGRNKNHRMYVLESESGPLGPYHFKGRVSVPGHDRWAIDGTITEIHGELYYAWSGWPGARNGRQNLYLAKMKNPWTVSEHVTCISEPEHAWESWINEGPQFLHRGSDTFVVYSANKSWTDDYKLGLLKLEGRDPLNPASWRKSRMPVFDSIAHPHEAIYAPGHCSFFTDPHGHQWLLYHVAKGKGAGWRREVRAQQWRWNENGDPIFGYPLPLKRSHEQPLTAVLSSGIQIVTK